VKGLEGFSGILMGGVAVIAAVQPAIAAPVQITAVQLTPTNTGVDITLQTQNGTRPAVFAVNRGNSWTADVPNAKLAIPGGTFRQENPAPGITLITVMAMDANSVRVTVTGEKNIPTGQVVRPDSGGVVLSMAPGKAIALNVTPPAAKPTAKPTPKPTAKPAAKPAPNPTATRLPVPPVTPTITAPTPLAPAIIPQSDNSQTRISTGKISAPDGTVFRSSVSTLTPDASTPSSSPTAENSQTGSTAMPPSAASSPSNNPSLAQLPLPPVPSLNAQTPVVPAPNTRPAPPMIRRAVPPPVGDISVSQLDSSPGIIDLGTNERIPRLVLRDAPVREVLSLLARAANLNLTYVDPSAGKSSGQQAGQQPTSQGPVISLDIENESVQDVFNYVLRATCIPTTPTGGGSTGGIPLCSSLEANLMGRTLFVGPRLPDTARNILSRTLRMNQVNASDAAGYLSTLGAETRQLVTGGTRRVTERDAVTGVITTRDEPAEPRVATVKVDPGSSPVLLQGLSVTSDPRLNTITLVGIPRKVEMASILLTQLDARKRQVSVNVKIVDVNLSNLDEFNASFSFGVGSSFFSVDQGAFLYNYGGFSPPSNAAVAGSLTTPPTITNPYTEGIPLLSPTERLTVPNGGTGLQVIENGFLRVNEPGDANFLLPTSPTNADPLRPGITDFTPGKPAVVTITTDPTTGARTASFAEGTLATATSALPSLFQFPSKFLSRLQAQITSRNAKILTDPTLLIQEGQSSKVTLTQQIVANITVAFSDTAAGTRETRTFDIKDAGLTLGIEVSRIDDNGFISMKVTPEVTAPTQTFDTGAGQAVLLSTRRVESGTLRVRDGQTLILAGIIQDSDRVSTSKVPILGDLPLIGALFRSTNRQNDRQEVIVLLTPRILDDSQTATFGYGYTPSPAVRQMLDPNGNIRQ